MSSSGLNTLIDLERWRCAAIDAWYQQFLKNYLILCVISNAYNSVRKMKLIEVKKK